MVSFDGERSPLTSGSVFRLPDRPPRPIVGGRRRALFRRLDELSRSPDPSLARRRDVIRWRLALSYTPYVLFVARRYLDRTGMPLEDFFQEGMVGILKAVDRHDVSRAPADCRDPFLPFAKRYVHGHMRRHVYRMRGIVRFREPHLRAAKRLVGADDATFAVAPELARQAFRSYQPPADLATVDEETFAAPDPRLEAAEARVDVASLLPSCPARHRLLFRLSYGIGGDPPMGGPEIATVFGVTRTTVNENLRLGLAAMRSRIGHIIL